MHLQNFMPAIYLHTLVQGQPWQGWFCNPGESVSKAGERGKGFMWSSEVFLKKNYVSSVLKLTHGQKFLKFQ